MPTIAEEAGIKERQAYNIVRDVDLARLVKVQEGGGRSRSNYYWFRVPWVVEPECVLDPPVLDNRRFPSGVRLKREEGEPPRMEVAYCVRVSRLKTLQPVAGEPSFESPSLARAAR